MGDHITAEVSVGVPQPRLGVTSFDWLIDITLYYASSQKSYVCFLSRLNITISLVRALCLKFGIVDRCRFCLTPFPKKKLHMTDASPGFSDTTEWAL